MAFHRILLDVFKITFLIVSLQLISHLNLFWNLSVTLKLTFLLGLMEYVTLSWSNSGLHCLILFLLCSGTWFSAARAWEHYILRMCLFILSSHFLRRRKTDILKLSHTTWFSPQQNLCNTDFSELPSPKINGTEKPKICTIFRDKLQTISAVIL